MKNKAFNQVVIFNQSILGIAPRKLQSLDFKEMEISVKCLEEEAKELYDSDNLVDGIDAVIDSLYFGMGILYKMGVDAQLFNELFSAVHNANMDKKIGVNKKRDTGAADAVKPPHWVSPEARIAEILKTRGVK